ncbi:MAG: hypothetical protein JO352_27565 [Chloroflexi bacterium]|nr:hypothetical protein [Chloroflexota bacterium]MBV9596398.1 hypothetical protein [Chloroflexota bacterium]
MTERLELPHGNEHTDVQVSCDWGQREQLNYISPPATIRFQPDKSTDQWAQSVTGYRMWRICASCRDVFTRLVLWRRDPTRVPPQP